jgi:hypothetical protein
MLKKSKRALIIICAVALVILLTASIFLMKKEKAPEYDPLKYNSIIHTVSGGEIQENANINRISLENF